MKKLVFYYKTALEENNGDDGDDYCLPVAPGMECFLIEKFSRVNELNDKQLQKIFAGAEAASKGLPIVGRKVGTGLMQKGEEVVALKNELKKRVEDKKDLLNRTEPVEDYKQKVTKVLRNWKNKFGKDSGVFQSAIKAARTGRQNPQKGTYILSVLTSLNDAINDKHFSVASPGALAILNKTLETE